MSNFIMMMYHVPLFVTSYPLGFMNKGSKNTPKLGSFLLVLCLNNTCEISGMKMAHEGRASGLLKLLSRQRIWIQWNVLSLHIDLDISSSLVCKELLMEQKIILECTLPVTSMKK